MVGNSVGGSVSGGVIEAARVPTAIVASRV
jgi:hypothetical protein